MIHSGSNSLIDQVKMEHIPEIDRRFPIACYEYSLQDRSEPWHWHNEFELNILLEGTAKCRLGSSTYLLEAGDGIFINSARLHSLLPNGFQPGYIKCFVFRKELIAADENNRIGEKYVKPFIDCADFHGLKLKKNIPWQKEVLQIVKEIMATCKEEYYGYELSVCMQCGRVLSLICPQIANFKTNLPEGMSDKLIFLKPMLLYVWEHFQEPVTLEEIARAAMISKNECMLCFRVGIGTSPIQYVKVYRLQKAAERLKSTGDSISSIADACGFQDGGYFARAFKKYYGTTPLTWRKLHRS